MYNFVSPCSVANTIIKKGWEEKTKITPIRLNVLIYFLYATYLKTTGARLFNEHFEIGEYNVPMIASIDYKFGHYRGHINKFARDAMGNVSVVSEEDVFTRCLDTIWGKYKNCTDSELCELSRGNAFLNAKKSPYNILDDIDIVEEGTEIIKPHEKNYIKNR